MMIRAWFAEMELDGSVASIYTLKHPCQFKTVSGNVPAYRAVRLTGLS